MTRSAALRASLGVAAATVAAAAACTLNPQPLPPVDFAGNGGEDGGAFSSAPSADAASSPRAPELSADAASATSTPGPGDGGGMPPGTAPADGGDAGAVDAGDAGDAN